MSVAASCRSRQPTQPESSSWQHCTVLHRSLVDAARRRGVEIRLQSEVVGAHPDGVLELRDGTEDVADVVVGADGVGSAVRETLGLTRRHVVMKTGGMRFLIPRRPQDPVGTAFEHWHGSRVVGILPCSSETVYVYFGANAGDTGGDGAAVDLGSWISSFPHLREVLGRLEGDGHWTAFESVQTRAWSRGRAALVGDAAHAMPPTLGQGACLAMANARVLAHSLSRASDPRTALVHWEKSERSVTDTTQRWSNLYLRVSAQWPASLLDARSALVRWAGRSEWVHRRTAMAATHESSLVGPA